MRVEIHDQIRLLAAALLLGMALSLVYDLLRALRLRRRRTRWFTDALDIAFSAALTLSLFLFALRVGAGELRLYALGAAGLGAGLYRAALAPLLRPLWDFWARTFFLLLRVLRFPLRWCARLCRRGRKIGKRL